MTQDHIQQEAHREIYWIWADLFSLTQYIHETLHQVISIFFLFCFVF